MKMVFKSFDSHLAIKKGKVSIICIEPPVLFANMVSSAVSGYVDDTIEQCFLFDDYDNRLTENDMWFIGDICMLDLGDKKILQRALKKIDEIVTIDEELKDALEKDSILTQERIQDHLLQMHGNYGFLLDWDLIKYLKAFNFGIDVSLDKTLFDKLIHLTSIAIDLFPETLLCFVNLKRYLCVDQYVYFCRQVESGGLTVLLYESGSLSHIGIENCFYVDSDFMEMSVVAN